MIDTHAHLTFETIISTVDAILEKARKAGVTTVIVPGTDLEDSKKSQELAEKYANIYAGIGLHPSEADTYSRDIIQDLKNLGKAGKKMVVVGDVGLDYFHNQENKEKQQELFREMIRLAKKCSLPLSIHNREAFLDVYRIYKEEGLGHPAVVHCFSGNWSEAEAWLDLGVWLSFTGVLTYKKNEELREVARQAPLDMIMLETDAPFLPPEGYRGQVCEPWHVKVTAECLAQVRQTSLDEIDEITSKNALEFFKLK